MNGQPGTGLASRQFDELLSTVRRVSVPEQAPSDESSVGPTARQIADQLGELVRGQPEVVDVAATCLEPALNGLRLNPHRPLAVLLANGTTGVGKTTLAFALARLLNGSDAEPIRVDGSELSAPTAINRLIGSPPGYVGHDQPESWLTTKVKKAGRCVVLIDEFEKASPEVWNLFLQVADAGRLTDARGTTVSFADTIVVLTANIGAREAERGPVGFAIGARRDGALQLNHDVAQALPPELRSRLDAVLQFRALDEPTLLDIARHQVQRLVSAVADAGWQLQVPDEVVEYLVEELPPAALGARPQERILERRFAGGLAGKRPGKYRASLAGDDIEWSPCEGT